MPKLTRIFLIFFGFILCLIFLEIILRVSIPEKKEKINETAYDFKCYTKGDYYWYKLKSSEKCILHSNYNAFEDLIIKTNSLGLRNAEINPQKATDSARILFIGDSFTFGMGVKAEKTFSKLVENILKDSIKVEAINAGLPGSEIAYYYLFLKNEEEKINPDVVVVGFYPHKDISDSEFKPIWTKTDPSGLPLQVATEVVEVSKDGIIVSKNIPPKYRYPIIGKSKTFSFITDQIFKSTHKNARVSILASACLFKASCHDLDQDKAKTKKIFQAIKKETDKNNQKLLILIIPTIFQVYDEYRQDYGVLVPLSPYEKALPHSQFSQFFKNENIDYIDLLPIFLENKERVYFNNDAHWNEKGHEIVSQSINSTLINYLK